MTITKTISIKLTFDFSYDIVIDKDFTFISALNHAIHILWLDTTRQLNNNVSKNK